ncbi:MAG: glycosyl transferase, partial [Thermoanaerobaculum sp.]
TLPRLVTRDLEAREQELANFALATPLVLVIPCLISELEQPALAGILKELNHAPYIDTLLISLDRADAAGYARALEYFGNQACRTVVFWNDAEEVQKLVHEIEAGVGRLAPRGKGRAVWMALGYLIAERRARAVAFHDADVVHYRRTLLANLVTPVLHPLLPFDFAKAYYARFSDRLHGRVTRLLVRPFLQALGDVVGRHPYLSYLAAFRYPLSGELCFTTDLARGIRIPGDWGLEIGLLFEILRHRSPRRICQVDVADQFDHKHQELSPTDPNAGLHRMAVDIVKHLLRTFSAAGVVLNEGSFKSMRVAYQRYAEDAVTDSFAVAAFNGLAFDRHAEEEAVETFSQALAEGCEQFVADPLGTPPLPNWERVLSALPKVADQLVSTVRTLDGILEPKGRTGVS